jgi:hypothetical protein
MDELASPALRSFKGESTPKSVPDGGSTIMLFALLWALSDCLGASSAYDQSRSIAHKPVSYLRAAPLRVRLAVRLLDLRRGGFELPSLAQRLLATGFQCPSDCISIMRCSLRAVLCFSCALNLSGDARSGFRLRGQHPKCEKRFLLSTYRLALTNFIGYPILPSITFRFA